MAINTSHLLKELLNKPVLINIVAAGCGGDLAKTLIGYPGISKILYGITLTYSDKNTQAILKRNHLKHFVTQEVAEGLAKTANREIIREDYSPSPIHHIGVGITASISTNRIKKGNHRAFIRVTYDKFSYAIELDLSAFNNKQGIKNRMKEEKLITEEILKAILTSLTFME